jgi:hypothetical protein
MSKKSRFLNVPIEPFRVDPELRAEHDGKHLRVDGATFSSDRFEEPA